MLLEVIRSLYQYSAWANRRLLAAAAGLSPEQFQAEDSPPLLSVHSTLVHTLGAQWIWLSRWQGTSPSALPQPGDFPALADIARRWEALEAETQAFVAALTAERLAGVVAYTNTKGQPWAYPLWQQMLHQANHATQHRSEVAARLTHYGCSPGDLDYLIFLDVHPQRG